MGIITKLNDRGAVALVTTIILSILMTIITTGLITLMASEVRQSNDAEESKLAYYAAQSGVEKTLQDVIAAYPAKISVPACDAASYTDMQPNFPVGWTCVQVAYSASPSGDLNNVEQAQVVDTADISAPQYDRMVLYWDKESPGDGRTDNDAAFGMPDTPLPGNSWDGAAAVELSVVDYATVGSVISDIRTRNYLIKPSTGGASTINVSSGTIANPSVASCDKDRAPYHCSVTLNGFNTANRTYVYRIRARYNTTSYKMDFYNGGSVVKVPDGNISIDVTARAGKVYRRVVTQVPVKNSSFSGLNYVLFSDNNICKNYTLVHNLAIDGSYPCNLE